MRGNDGLEHTPTQFSIARKKAKKRDKVCQCCGCKKNLTVHHVFGKAKYPQYASLEINLVTLCWECHERFHKTYIGTDSVNIGTLTAFLLKYAKENKEQKERITQLIPILFKRIWELIEEIYTNL